MAGHGSTLEHLLPALKVPARLWSYERLIRRSRVPAGVWIFTDHERLSPFELSVAASVAEQLRQAGCRVLNHPAGVRTRMGLLEELWKAKINDYRAFRADEDPRPTRFPVFIRREFDHRSEGRDLLYSQAELDAALAALKQDGVPLIGRIVIEYASDEAAPGIWYRGSSYRVGDILIAHHMALDDQWLVKGGFGAAQLDSFAHRDEFLKRERSFVMNNEHADELRRAFDIAGVEYGRVDFGFFAGKLQVYEINTNPKHASREKVFGRIHPLREPTQRRSEDMLHEVIGALDGRASGSVALGGRLLKTQRRRLPIRLSTWRRP